MTMSAVWNTIYTAGHDAAILRQTDSGWQLDGMAVYVIDGEPAQIRYGLQLHQDWSTRSGFFEGFVGPKPVKRVIERDKASWTLDGVRQDVVADALDLDFGFTPATNHPQLRRMVLEVGQSREIIVAWMDVGSDALEPLPQIYARVADYAYDYNSPQNHYRETLEIAPNGFVRTYPTLWKMIAPGE